MDSVLLKAQELSYSYHTLNGETPALDRVSFCLYRKEFLAIVGPSGCGKSTILSLIAGLLTPGSGGITFYGENGHQPGIGYMLQHDLLFEWRNVWQNVTLGLEIAHKDTARNLERVRRMLLMKNWKNYMLTLIQLFCISSLILWGNSMIYCRTMNISCRKKMSY